jgi:hypothetical protein
MKSPQNPHGRILMSEEKGPFLDLRQTHDHEEKLWAESLALVQGDPEMAKRLLVIENAMAVIFAYTVDYTSKTTDENTLQMLGIRLFNAAAAGLKLALSGYYQIAFHQARDVMETGFLFDYFRTSPKQISVWRAADRATRRKLFEPVKIRIALDERDGDVEKRRAAEYSKLSELASHASYRGFRLTARGGVGELGPFVERANLIAWLHEMVLRLGPSAVLYANHFPNAEERFVRLFQEFGSRLILGFKEESGFKGTTEENP